MKAQPMKLIAATLLTALIYEIIFPLAATALTSGPAQPEFSSFEPVATTSMVNEFTGAFTYNLPVLNIPGPSGSGYALSLSYHSGASIEEEASWCGYGWTLNPGAIMRNKRGIPDDDNGSTIKYWNKVPRNWTVSAGGAGSLELFSIDALTANLNASLRYNNYRGFGTTLGIGLGVKGVGSLGYSLTDGEGSFSYGINPAGILSQLLGPNKNDEEASAVDAAMATSSSSSEKKNPTLKDYANAAMDRAWDNMTSHYGMYSFSTSQRPTNITAYEGTSYNFKVGAMMGIGIFPAGPKGVVLGSYTTQQNLPENGSDNLRGYGYMYSANAGGADIMDYYREKEAGYTKRDYYLSIPFSNADNFLATGEGISGGFRLYNKKAGQFHPNQKTSETSIYQIGAEVHAGQLNVGLGTDVGIGGHTLNVGNWGMSPAYTFANSSDNDEPFFFRFNNDLGGSVEFAGDHEAERASIVTTTGASGYVPRIAASQIKTSMNDGQRSGRSSYIGYRTNREMIETPDAGCNTGLQPGIYYNAYTKSPSARKFVNRNDSRMNHGIGEFAITNESGMRYVYGLPVYARKEKNLQYGLDGLSRSQIKENYLAMKSVLPTTADVVVGEERDAAYASMYLLTEISTPDYVDRANDGPTPDDFGGYTKFVYRRTAGTDNKIDGSSSSWYRWRMPYTGLLYHRRSLSDPMDDVGGVVSGEKEMYYLDTIETKTHFAVFNTSPREDAFHANADEAAAANGTGPTFAVEDNRSLKLDSINLYAKGVNGQPPQLIRTVRFEYENSLCQDLPNAVLSGGGPLRKGKLTLKKVWFESNGVRSARISPYVFGYEYKRSSSYGDLPLEQRRMYDTVIRYGDSVTVASENPNYSPYDIDRWGNYQYNGKARYARFQQWLNQNPSRSDFDPAAWQLKWIRLPSGGEIHVQYEQNEYTHVQDRPAMAMVSLKSSGSDGGTGKFYLNVADLGLADNATNAELTALKSIIEKRFKYGDERIYFKMLYPLMGTSANFTNCLSEYITGYAHVLDVGIDIPGNGLWIKIGSRSGDEGVRDICTDLFNASKGGKLRFGQDCEASKVGIEDDLEVGDLVMALLAKIVNTYTASALACNSSNINYGESYLRIPMVRPKRGGGIRVKRLLMFDHGLEDGTGKANLYGSEYLYVTEDGKCSGVATNEPPTGREENALVVALEKNEDVRDEIIAGDDQGQLEGPVGESILPGASVGYSRVVVRNIFHGKTNAGFTVNEFFTAKDFPFDQEISGAFIDGKGVANTTIDSKEDWFPGIPFGPFEFHRSNIWATQGYRFVINSMHGQVKKVASYGGDPFKKNTWVLTASQAFDYFKPGETVPMMYGVNDIRMKHPGKEMEVVFDSREINDVNDDVRLQVDLSVGLVGFIPIPFPTAFPNFTFGENKLRTHVTTKIIRYPAIQKSMTAFRDGVYHHTKNVGFDPSTGRVILTQMTDGYNGLALQQSGPKHDGSYYTYSFPAYQQYPDMGQKAATERAVIKTTANIVIEKWYDTTHYLNFRFKAPNLASTTLSRLTSGDLVRITNTSGQYRGLYHIGRIAGNKVQLLTTSFDVGTYTLPESVNIEVIRSGRTNQLTALSGSITTYGKQHLAVDHPLQP